MLTSNPTIRIEIVGPFGSIVADGTAEVELRAAPLKSVGASFTLG